ncbi:unnamed protein product [Lupinus luteus]|uniref:Uncharacterized protein n=1 Tax=Lupinus luteus TaxID=3873 RepID=A0AAV1WMQ4_LUPLU
MHQIIVHKFIFILYKFLSFVQRCTLLSMYILYTDSSWKYPEEKTFVFMSRLKPLEFSLDIEIEKILKIQKRARKKAMQAKAISQETDMAKSREENQNSIGGLGRRTWQDCLDVPSSSRVVRSKVLGGASCKKAPGRRTSPPPPNYAFELGQSEEEDEVIELINTESSIEVVDLVSDSDTEEDPSEGSSLPNFSFCDSC